MMPADRNAARAPAATPSTPRSGWARFVELSLRNGRGAATPMAPRLPAPRRAAAPPPRSLSHHELLQLIEPCVRSGRQLDLAASDRLHGRLVFKPTPHGATGAAAQDATAAIAPTPSPTPALPLLHETLLLQSPRPGRCRLTRELRDEHGLCARLQAEGAHPGELLAGIEAVAAERQWLAEPGFIVAQSHRLGAGGRIELTDAEVRLDGLTLKLSVSTTPGVSADIDVQPRGRTLPTLPDDLLAVLGWSWSALSRGPAGWRGSLRLCSDIALRSREAEQQLRTAARHLARTLAEPPRAFHERLRGARWAVLARRSIPLTVAVSLPALAAAARPLDWLPANSLPGGLLMAAPALLLLLFFMRSEAPRLELPPLPRRQTATDWSE